MNNENKCAISVIVPCYNVEEYLDRSLGSLERQWNGRSDYEIILINDASTDGTISKLNDFRERYPDNVIVIDKKINEGVGKARNSGLDIARGDWIVFFDPDDALVDIGYCKLLELAQANKNTMDVLSFGVYMSDDANWDNSQRCVRLDDMSIEWVKDGYDYVKYGFSGVSVKYLFKKEVINGRRFKNLCLFEDYIFVLPLFLSDIRVGQTESKIYFYIQRMSSATNTMDARRLNRGCDDILSVLKEIGMLKQGQSNEIQQVLYDRQLHYSKFLFTRLLLSDKTLEELNNVRQKLRDLEILPFKNKDLKTRLRNFAFNYIRIIQLFRPVYRRIHHYQISK